MSFEKFCQVVLVLLFVMSKPGLATDFKIKDRLDRFTFGSCNDVVDPQPLWKPLLNKNPQFFMWVGDSVYADTEDMSILARFYKKQLSIADYKAVTLQMPILGVWDDHDYGRNDAGKEYPMKAQSQQLFLDFIGESKNSPRRGREGLYASYDFGPEGQRVKLIILDTRYFRDQPETGQADILGEAQWTWFEEELANSTAQVHLVVSSYSVLFFANNLGEQWTMFPLSFHRLERLVHRYQPPGLIFLTGDRHFTGIYSSNLDGQKYYELMSSGLTRGVSKRHRFFARLAYGRDNSMFENSFGMIDIDWSNEKLLLIFSGVLKNGGIGFRKRFQLIDDRFIEI